MNQQPHQPVPTQPIPQVPLRVDLAGGWLDVPSLARPDGFVVNCAISPLVSLADWPYEIGGGLGGSAAHAILEGRDSIRSEIILGVGWQDPAILIETGLCVWKSGPKPVLAVKRDGSILASRMAVCWTGKRHYTPDFVGIDRDYDLILRSSQVCAMGVQQENFDLITAGVDLYHQAQLKEGMDPLPRHGEVTRKYCGGGWGGYAVYIFRSGAERDAFVSGHPEARKVEPYCSWDDLDVESLAAAGQAVKNLNP